MTERQIREREAQFRSYETCVARGDWGPALWWDELVEYDDDEWFCECDENHCSRSPELRREAVPPPDGVMRINLLTQRPCSEDLPCLECYCSPGAIILWKGDAMHVRLDDLHIPGEMARAVDCPAGECVYLVQLMPDMAPLRLKVGYSTNVAGRVKAYRTGCPTAHAIAVMPGHRGHEDRLIAAFAGHFRHVGGETFDVDSVSEAVDLFHRTLRNPE